MITRRHTQPALSAEIADCLARELSKVEMELRAAKSEIEHYKKQSNDQFDLRLKLERELELSKESDRVARAAYAALRARDTLSAAERKDCDG